MGTLQRWFAGTVVLVVFVAFGPGCESGVRSGSFGVNQKSYDLRGETVQVDLLNVKEYRARLEELGITPNDAVSFVQMTSFDFGIGAVVGKLIELGGKWIRGEIEAEASRYRQQFTGSAFEDGFWAESERAPTGEVEQRIVAVRVRRYTALFPDGGTAGAAFDFLAALKVSGDRNFLVIYPLYLKTQSTKAKVIGDQVQTEFALEQTGHWLDAGGVLKTSILANATKKVTCRIGDTMKWNENNKGSPVMWGALVAPPISANAPKGVGTGMLHVSVLVTEADQTKAAEYLRKAATLVEEKTPEIATAVRARVEKALNDAEKSRESAPAVAPAPSATPPGPNYN